MSPAAKRGDAPASPIGPAATAALVGLLCVVWGSTWIVIRGGLADLPPFTSAAARFILAALLMVAVCRALAAREGGGRAPLWLVAATGTLNFAGSYGAVYVSEQVLPSALASILFAVFPLLVALLAHVLLPDERLRPANFAGFALGFAGVALLFATDVRNVGPDAVPYALVFLVSPVVSALGTTLVKRHGGRVSSLRLNRDGMFVGAALLALLALVFERGEPATWSAAAIGSVLYLAVVGTVVTFSIYFWLLRHVPAYRMSIIPYVTPVVAIGLGAAFAGEAVGPTTFAGMGLILAGVLLATRKGAKRAG